jgi:hypothetical protein
MVTSGGRTASTPYIEKKGVSPVARLGEVRLAHSAHGSSSTHFFAMLLQAIVCVSPETLEYFCVGSINLTIAFWMSNRCIANLDAQVFTVPLESIVGKLGPVVSYDSIRDPKPADDRVDELDCCLHVDLDHRGCFRSLSEFFDGNV